jgi:GTP cyclohydrolase II
VPILLDLEINKERLITNNSKRASYLERYGLVEEIISLLISANSHNEVAWKLQLVL